MSVVPLGKEALPPHLDFLHPGASREASTHRVGQSRVITVPDVLHPMTPCFQGKLTADWSIMVLSNQMAPLGHHDVQSSGKSTVTLETRSNKSIHQTWCVPRYTTSSTAVNENEHEKPPWAEILRRNQQATWSQQWSRGVGWDNCFLWEIKHKPQPTHFIFFV